jgi:hypothetical protein
MGLIIPMIGTRVGEEDWVVPIEGKRAREGTDSFYDWHERSKKGLGSIPTYRFEYMKRGLGSFYDILNGMKRGLGTTYDRLDCMIRGLGTTYDRFDGMKRRLGNG